MIDIPIEGGAGRAYLAQPAATPAPGVLVLHAWWGLTPFFHSVCDRLARAGFVALAPDLYHGRTADTIEAAQALLGQRDFARMQATATGALEALRERSAAGPIAALGFSMGGAWALELASAYPADISAAVIFYGSGEADFGAARAAYLGHFGENDEWEPLDDLRQMEASIRAAGREITTYIYPGAQHWFVEDNRPEYHAAAAELAWQRTLAFLGQRLGKAGS